MQNQTSSLEVNASSSGSSNSGGKKVLIFIIVFLILLALAIGIYYWYQNYLSKDEAQIPEESPALSLDAEKIATHLSKVAQTENVYWQRMWEIWWEAIEREEGSINFAATDRYYKDVIQKEEIYMVATIKPFANWDQNECHDSTYEADYVGMDKTENSKIKVGKPCNMEKYQTFLAAVVERYDGDGKDDMPGLSIPVKYWEIMNEPSMQGGSTGGVGEELKFFVGTSTDYLDILKASYETIKSADSEAKVLHAGMAGMQQSFRDFWDPVFSGGGGNYFDVANIHSINTDENREGMYVIKFKKYLESFGIKDKPIFVTEAQFGELAERPADIQEFDKLIARATIFTIAQGADVIFYIDNWLQWDRFKAVKEQNISGEEEKEEGPMSYSEEDLATSTHKVYLNLVNMVNKYEAIETIEESYFESSEDRDGASTQIAQYKFINGNNIIYVLWGEANLPAEISGQVKVTDIYGASEEKDASEIQLTDSPIFVEKL